MPGPEQPEPTRGDGDTSGNGGQPPESRGVPAELRDVSFPLSVRGYDREAVDTYVTRVQQVVAELEVSRSPEAAVKQALAELGERTKGILEQAGQTAEEITVAARREADETSDSARGEAAELVAKAKAEADEILAHSNAEAQATVAHAENEAADRLRQNRDEIAALQEEAEARRRELKADTDAIRQERTRLLSDLREVTTRVDEVAAAADARFPTREAAEPERDGAPSGDSEGENAAAESAATQQQTAETGSPRASSE